MNTEFLISMAVQIPLVVLFAWFVLKRDKDYQASTDKRDGEWRDFFREMQKENTVALNKLATVMESLSRQVAKNTVTVLMHDATVKGENPDTLGSTEDILRKILE